MRNSLITTYQGTKTHTSDRLMFQCSSGLEAFCKHVSQQTATQDNANVTRIDYWELVTGNDFWPISIPPPCTLGGVSELQTIDGKVKSSASDQDPELHRQTRVCSRSPRWRIRLSSGLV